ncbi:calcium-binding and coiled-coil domain-containing protein 2 [Triplophysa dalaica]|uniref:calcium-binding and coiled-coil domain-containing protein 2 n=1 Tax=Triplophysa dalaica TaxID=1582913 RepID=UPI0024DF5E24|nr:calcium-binding and coiled-coil domain-containing protein 2 [Triplophysa dalaica]
MNDREDEETIPVVMDTSSFSQVVFNDVPPSYPPKMAVTCRYTITEGLQPNPRDWIGIFKVGWQSTQRYYSYEWVVPCLDQIGPEGLTQEVVFKESNLPKDDGEFYQFCHVDCNGHVRGASTPFCFQNQAEISLDCSLEKDLLVVTTQEQVTMMEKEKEDLMKEMESLKESNEILKKELDERLHEMCRLRSCLDDLKSKEKPETPLSDIPNYNITEQSLTNLHENFEKAVRKIKMLKQERAELQQQVELQFAENLKLNTCLKETDHNYNKLQDRVKLLEVDAQSSAKHNEKLHAEIEELLIVKRTLEEKKGEDKELQASMSEHRGEDNETKVQIRALLTQLIESRGLLRSEMQNCKEATKRAESAEQELKDVKQKLAEMPVNEAEAERHSQIQAQLEQAQNKIYEMAETSRSDKQEFIEKNEELQAEVARLHRIVMDNQVASVPAISEQLPNPQSPPPSSNTQEQTYPPDYHFYGSIDDMTGDQSRKEDKMKCLHCHESFPGISEDELAQHEQSHKVCPFCTLICDDWEQQMFEDHVYSHED